jgi:NAD(P)-dependent dehydrogenase (short-subunit alcohol dehydrogenase family)
LTFSASRGAWQSLPGREVVWVPVSPARWPKPGPTSSSPVVGRDMQGHLESTARSVRAVGRECLTVPTDVTRPSDCAALVEAAVDHFGRVDVLVNNAGLSHVTPASRERPEDFRSVVDVNLFGAYRVAQACAAVMGNGSSIINVSSMLGLVKSELPQAAYAASKAGLIGLTRDLSNQWAARKGIRVNAIARIR